MSLCTKILPKVGTCSHFLFRKYVIELQRKCLWCHRLFRSRTGFVSRVCILPVPYRCRCWHLCCMRLPPSNLLRYISDYDKQGSCSDHSLRICLQSHNVTNFNPENSFCFITNTEVCIRIINYIQLFIITALKRAAFRYVQRFIDHIWSNC